MYNNKTYILTLYKNSKICVPESGNATVKHLIETVEFKRILKIKLSPIFWFLKVFLINRFFFYNIIDYNWMRQKTNEKYFT